MKQFDPNGQALYLALKDFYPRVSPSMEFVSNVFTAFEEATSPENAIEHPWAIRLEKWLPSNVGLIRDPLDVNWDKFIVVDPKLYSFALLRYS